MPATLKDHSVQLEATIKPNVNVSWLISAQVILRELRALLIIRTYVNVKTLSVKVRLITLVNMVIILRDALVPNLARER